MSYEYIIIIISGFISIISVLITFRVLFKETYTSQNQNSDKNSSVKTSLDDNPLNDILNHILIQSSHIEKLKEQFSSLEQTIKSLSNQYSNNQKDPEQLNEINTQVDFSPRTSSNEYEDELDIPTIFRVRREKEKQPQQLKIEFDIEDDPKQNTKEILEENEEEGITKKERIKGKDKKNKKDDDDSSNFLRMMMD